MDHPSVPATDRPSRIAVRIGISLAAALTLAAAGERPAPQPGPDLVLRGGIVLDGSGAPGRRADVAIRDGVIMGVDDIGAAAADREIDVSGLHVAPGFIDLHSHADEGLSDPARADAVNFLTQGVTTAVVGQDGGSPWRADSTLAERAAEWRSSGIGLNVVPLVGHISIRRQVTGGGCEPADAEQLRAMAGRVEDALRQGAWGLSTGVGFAPCASFRELVRVTRPVAESDAVHISHIRDEADGVLGAVTEMVLVAAVTGGRVVVSHIKASGSSNWGKATEIVEIVETARKAGVDVYADLYPYTTSGSGYDVAIVPSPDAIPLPDDHAGERPRDIRAWLDDPVLARTLLESVEDPIRERGGPDRLFITRHADERLVGRTLAQVAAARGLDPARTAIGLTAEDAAFMHRQMSEQDVAVFIQQPFVAASSDGWIPRSIEQPHHPRSYGAFTRRLRRFVRELDVITLPFAIRAATGLPAEILGLRDRGLVKPGYVADLVAFDPRRTRDRATYGDPHRTSEGIRWVVIHGEVTIADGVPTGVRAGEVLLRRPAQRPAARTGRVELAGDAPLP